MSINDPNFVEIKSKRQKALSRLTARGGFFADCKYKSLKGEMYSDLIIRAF